MLHPRYAQIRRRSTPDPLQIQRDKNEWNSKTFAFRTYHARTYTHFSCHLKLSGSIFYFLAIYLHDLSEHVLPYEHRSNIDRTSIEHRSKAGHENGPPLCPHPSPSPPTSYRESLLTHPKLHTCTRHSIILDGF